MENGAADAIRCAALADGIFVSPVSAWEVGLLSRPGRATMIRFLPDPKT
jgi:PIN domain nuclease of toxin-antitoxin system